MFATRARLRFWPAMVAAALLVGLVLVGGPVGVGARKGPDPDAPTLSSSLTSQNASRTVTFTYDNAGRLTAADYGNARISHTYDNASNILEQRTTESTATPTPTATATATPTRTPTVTPTPTSGVRKVYLPIVVKGP